MDESEEQLGFELGEMPASGSHEPNLGHVREDLNAILQEARSGLNAPPWDARTFRYKKIIFIQLTKWLPEDEAEQLCFEFAKELERIEQLLAA